MKAVAILNQSGVSLVSTIMAVGFIGVAALGMTKIAQMGNNSKVSNESNFEYVNFQTELNSFLLDSRRCSGSLKGLVFKGSTINTQSIDGSPTTSPVDVELKNIDLNGNIGATRFRGDMTMPGLYIKAIKLTIPEYTDNVDFTVPASTVPARLVVYGTKKIASKQSRDFRPIKRELNLSFNTDLATGESTITGCAMAGGGSVNSGAEAAPWGPAVDGMVAKAGDRLIVDTSSGEISISLPPAPTVGDHIELIDGTGSFSTYALTIISNGNKIMGQEDDMEADVDEMSLGLIYVGPAAGWRFF